jgi:general secretion pathway protein G
MRIRNARPIRRAFTLIEILIVVVILGILAAIVIPQFTDASQEANNSSVRSQLQTIRSQVELFQLRNAGTMPDFAANGWDEMVDATQNAQGVKYLQQEPRNPLRDNATDIITGVAVPPAASGGAATDGWYFNTNTFDTYAINTDGTLMDW